MIQVLVTGASGFIGGKLARRLVENGHGVRCQYRRAIPPENLKELESRGAQLHRLDLAPPRDNSVEKLDEFTEKLGILLRDVDIVYHIAAFTSDWGAQELFERANVQATESLLDAAERSGVRRFIDVSSISVHGFGPHRNSTEDGPYYPPTHYYQETKRRAEEIAISRNRKGFEVCVIRPGNVYGPDDTTMMFPMFEAIEKGMMGTVGGGKALTPPVYIDDMVDALELAGISETAAGEIINVTGGEDITWRRFTDLAADALGAKRPRANLPAWIALPLAKLLNGLWQAVGARKGPPLTPYRIKHVIDDFHFDISKARRLLGYVPKTRCEQGLRNAAESYKRRRT